MAAKEVTVGAMAIERLRAVTIWVSDVDAAVDFYVDQLGLEKTAEKRYGDKGRWVTVSPGGSDGPQISLSPAGYGGEPGSFTGMVLETSDVDATYEELKGRGVNFTSEVRTNTWGRRCATSRTRDGNGFRLHSK